MIAVADSTVILHLNKQYGKMMGIIKEHNISKLFITRINYLEILAGASENAKIYTRKVLQQYPILEFDRKGTDVANKLAMEYRISNKNSKDFLIAIANKLPLLTENNRDFNYTELTLLPYRI